MCIFYSLLYLVVIILGVVKCVLAAHSSAEMESRRIHKSSCDPHHVTPFEVFMKHVVLTLCTQSFMSVSPMHLSSALADSTRMKLCARCTLWMSLSSNLPASSFSTSMNTLYPRTWRCTFSRLCERQGKQPCRSQITWECMHSRVTNVWGLGAFCPPKELQFSSTLGWWGLF